MRAALTFDEHPEELRVDFMLWQRSQQVLPASHQAAAPLPRLRNMRLAALLVFAIIDEL